MREDVRDAYRQEALEATAKATQQTPLLVLLDTLTEIDDESSMPSTRFDLGRLLANWPASELRSQEPRLRQLALAGKSPTTRQLGFVALMMARRRNQRKLATGRGVDPVAEGSRRGVADAAGPRPAGSALCAVESLLDALPEGLAAKLDQGGQTRGTYGRFVRIELPGRRRTLTLAEVEVFSDGQNVARQGQASQSATAHGGVAGKAIDGNRNPSYGGGGQTHTPEGGENPWWELDLGEELPLESIAIYNRDEGNLGSRLEGFTLLVLDSGRNPVFVQENIPAPRRSDTFALEAGGPQGTIRRAAMQALPYVRGHEAHTFSRLAQFVTGDLDRIAAMRAILRIPLRDWPVEEVQPLLEEVLAYARGIPADQRNLPAATDALQLADSLTRLLPSETARPIRRELRTLGVRKLRLGTVPHRMAYDEDRLVVEAGKAVEIVFENNDIMPHNFVITEPGALEEIGLLGEATAQQPGALQRQFVPPSAKILLASDLLQPRANQVLRFDAPPKPGIYPFVCTYPGHWRRMYGSLIVVHDLDEFDAQGEAYLAAHEISPQDELLKTVRPSREWKMEDLAPAMDEFENGRSFATGRRMFQMASCVACHRLNEEGNEIGPDLTKLDVKLTPLQILKHLVEPSSEINKDYQTYVVELDSGQVLTGLVIAQGPDSISLVENPLLSAQPRIIRLNEIESRTASPNSIMPEGLLDKLTRDEILDVLAYVYARGSNKHMIFQGHHEH